MIKIPLIFITMMMFCGLSTKAQQFDTTKLSAVPVYTDTTALSTDIADFYPIRLSDEEARIMIMRIMRYGTSETSMLNDPLFAPGERYYDLFKEHRPSPMINELPAIESIRRQMQLEKSNARKAAAAGAIYWWLQWLLILL